MMGAFFVAFLLLTLKPEMTMSFPGCD